MARTAAVGGRVGSRHTLDGMPRVLPVVLAVALWIYGVIDCAQTPRHRMPAGLGKPVWLGITILVPALGALAWLVISRLAQADGGTKLPKRRPKGPTAPDDDPEFLANLDWQARKAHYERQKLAREQEKRDAAAAAAAAAASGDPRDAFEMQAEAARQAAASDSPAEAGPANEATDEAPDEGPNEDPDAPDSPVDGESSSTPQPSSIEDQLAALEAQFNELDEDEDPHQT